jgi:hypothetical protein
MMTHGTSELSIFVCLQGSTLEVMVLDSPFQLKAVASLKRRQLGNQLSYFHRSYRPPHSASTTSSSLSVVTGEGKRRALAWELRQTALTGLNHSVLYRQQGFPYRRRKQVCSRLADLSYRSCHHLEVDSEAVWHCAAISKRAPRKFAQSRRASLEQSAIWGPTRCRCPYGLRLLVSCGRDDCQHVAHRRNVEES